MKYRLLILLVILSALVTGCAPVVGQGQSSMVAQDLVLDKGRTIGQSLTSHHAGLQGIEVYLVPGDTGNGILKLHLLANPPENDLAISEIPISTVTKPGYYRFDFPAQKDSYLKDYLIRIDAAGEGSVQVGFASGDAYLDGSLYINSEPVDSQLTFQQVYEPVNMIIGLLRWGFLMLWYFIAGLFLYIIPGWTLLSVLWPGWGKRFWAEKVGLAAGVSLALYPIFLLWTSIVHLKLGPVYAWIPGGVGTAYIAIQNIRLWKKRLESLPVRFGIVLRSKSFWPNLTLIIVIGMIIFVRLYTVRTIPLPMWGDSYQHTMIAQLLVDNNGLFNSWRPYAELETFTYHFGFHTAVAIFHWITGVNLPQATLWVGQLMNILAVLALFPLATLVSHNRWAGIGAVLVAGLLLPMPMFYTNWGRYTQLTGQVILPTVMWMSWQLVQENGWGRKQYIIIGILSGIVLGGLSLTHYRVVIFAVAFLPIIILLNLRYSKTWRNLYLLSLLSGSAALVFFPWIIHLWSGNIVQGFILRLKTPVEAVTSYTKSYNSFGDLTLYMAPLVWILMLVSICWIILNHSSFGIALGIWCLIVVLLANPGWIKLPGTGALTNFAVLIAVYIPASIFIGYVISRLIFFLPQKPISLRGLGVLLVIVLGFFGMKQRVTDIIPDRFTLATRADLRAAQWINNNIPKNSTFLVNSFFAYGGSSVVGSDGGWWVPMIAYRSTTLPPLTYSAETGPRLDYQPWVNQLVASIETDGLDSITTLSELKKRGVTYIYIGHLQGKVNTPEALISLTEISNTTHFIEEYHEDRVRIYRILY